MYRGEDELKPIGGLEMRREGLTREDIAIIQIDHSAIDPGDFIPAVMEGLEPFVGPAPTACDNRVSHRTPVLASSA